MATAIPGKASSQLACNALTPPYSRRLHSQRPRPNSARSPTSPRSHRSKRFSCPSRPYRPRCFSSATHFYLASAQHPRPLCRHFTSDATRTHLFERARRFSYLYILRFNHMHQPLELLLLNRRRPRRLEVTNFSPPGCYETLPPHLPHAL